MQWGGGKERLVRLDASWLPKRKSRGRDREQGSTFQGDDKLVVVVDGHVVHLVFEQVADAQLLLVTRAWVIEA